MKESGIIYCVPPLIIQCYNKNLLDIKQKLYSHKLNEIGKWLSQKIDSREFKKFPNKKNLLKKKYQMFLELYERIKKEEEQNETKKNGKVRWLFYRPECSDAHCRNIFERLKKRVLQSYIDRRNNAFS